MKIRTIRQSELENKKVLLRIDLNVPFDKQMNIVDDSRLKSHVPTINYIIKHGGSPVIVSHIGRPKGIPEDRFSHKHVLKKLVELCGTKVIFCESTVGSKAERAAGLLKKGEILLLENARFYPEEKNAEESFCLKLSKLGNIFVMDSFASAHRKDCSVAGVAKFMPSYGGLLVEKEVNALEKLVGNIKRPYAAIIGGFKVSDKIKVLENLIKKIDVLLIGGAMAFTFLAAKGIKTGQSIIEKESFEDAEKIMAYADEKKVKIILPLGFSGYENGTLAYYKTDKMPAGFKGLDIDMETVNLFKDNLKDSKTIVWNGPLGVFEEKGFEKGTFLIADAITKSKAFSAAGGGDTSAAVRLSGCAEKFSHISVGGGAFIEYLSGNILPGLENIEIK